MLLKKLKILTTIFLNNFLPALPKPRYEYIQCLEKNGLPSSVVLLTYSSGNNTGNLHFIWKVPIGTPAEECFHNSLKTIGQARPLLSQFHTRAICQAIYVPEVGRVSPSVKPVLCLFHKDITSDCSASYDLPGSVVDKRVHKMLSMEIEDPNMVVNLKNKESRTRFEHFWSEAEKCI